MSNILLIDDEADSEIVETSNTLRSIIQAKFGESYTVVSETTGEINNIKNSIKNHQPIAILLDISWGEDKEKGFKLAPEIRKKHPKIPIIILSRHPRYVQKAIEKGIAYFFIDKSELVKIKDVVDSAIKQQEEENNYKKEISNPMGKEKMLKIRIPKYFLDSDAKIQINGTKFEYVRILAENTSIYPEDNIGADGKYFCIAGCSSERMKNTVHMCWLAARDDEPVLLYGENGVGKEVFAWAIHLWSKRKDLPLVTVDSTLLGGDPNLRNTLLFGCPKGNYNIENNIIGYFQKVAFIKYASRKPEYYKKISKNMYKLKDDCRPNKENFDGTIFIDELGDMDKSVQPAFLRVIQYKKCKDVVNGEYETRVKFIAASHYTLEELENEKLTKGLLSRFSHFIEIPPLDERKEDIEFLIKYFLEQKTNGNVEILLSNIKSIFQNKNINWRNGNVRLLFFAIRRCLVQTKGNVLYIPPEISKMLEERKYSIDLSGDILLKIADSIKEAIGKSSSLNNKATDILKKSIVEYAKSKNLTGAQVANLFGISESTFSDWRKKYDTFSR